MKNTTWLSAHLFYNDSKDELLKKGVAPLLEGLKRQKMVEFFFFIRYAEKGSHLRLRVLPRKRVYVSIIKKEIEDQIGAFFLKNPSTRTLEQDDFYPNDSVQWLEYIPETERYGGEQFIQAAELFFWGSSQLLLSLLPNIDNYDTKVGLSLQLNLSMLHTFGFDLSASRKMLQHYCMTWLPLANLKTNEPLNEVQQQETLALFQQQFQFDATAERLQDLWLQLNDLGKQPLDFIMKRWLAICANARIAYQQDGLTRPFEAIALDFMHMTNNRIGIFNQDEAYLGYYLNQSLKKIHEENP